MPIPADALSRFFDSLYGELQRDWNQRVDQGAMSEWTKQRKELLADEIGMILRMLAEGHAVLTYRPEEQREPAPAIWLPRICRLISSTPRVSASS